MKRSFLTGGLLLAVVAGLGSCGGNRAANPAGPASGSSRIVVARSRPLQRTLRLTGTTQPARSAVIVAPVLRSNRRRGDSSSFQLTLRKVAAAGAWVRAGEIVAEFDMQYMENNLSDHAANFVQRKANLNALLAQLRVRREAYEQTIKAAKGAMDKAQLERRKSPVLSDIQAERDRLAHEESQAHYRELLKNLANLSASIRAEQRGAELEVEESRVEMNRARTGLERLTIRAPVDGMVVRLPIRRGAEQALVEAGDELRRGQPFLQVIDGRSLLVHARANQVDASVLRVGARARAVFDIYPDLSLPARIVYVGSLATAGGRASRVHELPVRAAIQGTDSRLLPYLSAALDIVLEEAPAGPVLPRECVACRDGSGELFVLIRRPQGWHKTPVELGPASHIAVSVASGVSEGDTVLCGRPEETD